MSSQSYFITSDHKVVPTQDTKRLTIEVPESFRLYLKDILGSRHQAFLNGLEFEKRTTLRFNTLKTVGEEIRRDLQREGFVSEPLDFYSDAFLVKEEPTPISKTLEHFLGLFYIQSVASMIPPLVLDPQPGELVLDIAAAPGSKTTQMGQMMLNRGMLVANEWDGKRIKTLSHNLDRMGILNAAMVNMGGERIGNLLPETFDKALVDAPCSAIGVIHKAPQAIENLSFVQKFAFIQEQLFVSALKSLKVGGTLVYSTCTVTPEENEILVDRLARRYNLDIEAIQMHSSVSRIDGLRQFGSHEPLADSIERTARLLPNRINPEGFFVAKLRKKESIPMAGERSSFGNVRFDLVDADDPEIRQMADYFANLFGMDTALWRAYAFMKKDDEILITSGDWLGQEPILNRIHTHRIGMRIARTRRAGEWKLSTNAAQLFSSHITKNRIVLEDLAEIETFVAAGTLRRDFGIEKGGVVVFAHGHALGCGVIHQGALKSQMPKSRMVIGVDIV